MSPRPKACPLWLDRMRCQSSHCRFSFKIDIPWLTASSNLCFGEEANLFPLTILERLSSEGACHGLLLYGVPLASCRRPPSERRGRVLEQPHKVNDVFLSLPGLPVTSCASLTVECLCEAARRLSKGERIATSCYRALSSHHAYVLPATTKLVVV